MEKIESNKSEICEAILRALPEWFGIENSTKAYIAGVKETIFFAALDAETPIGFLSLKKHYSSSYEIYVMGIKKEFHGQGIGTKLLEEGEKYLKKIGGKYLQVKTLSENRPNPHYDKTRAFYIKSGFTPLEEFKSLWDKWNPCLLLIKSL